MVDDKRAEGYVTDEGGPEEQQGAAQEAEAAERAAEGEGPGLAVPPPREAGGIDEAPTENLPLSTLEKLKRHALEIVKQHFRIHAQNPEQDAGRIALLEEIALKRPEDLSEKARSLLREMSRGETSGVAIADTRLLESSASGFPAIVSYTYGHDPLTRNPEWDARFCAAAGLYPPQVVETKDEKTGLIATNETLVASPAWALSRALAKPKRPNGVLHDPLRGSVLNVSVRPPRDGEDPEAYGRMVRRLGELLTHNLVRLHEFRYARPARRAMNNFHKRIEGELAMQIAAEPLLADLKAVVEPTDLWTVKKMRELERQARESVKESRARLAAALKDADEQRTSARRVQERSEERGERLVHGLRLTR